jgi:hypothetical protein
MCLMAEPDSTYSHSSALGCRWMSCLDPGRSTVRPTTVFSEPTVSAVMSQRTSMSTHPSSARSDPSGDTAVEWTT